MSAHSFKIMRLTNRSLITSVVLFLGIAWGVHAAQPSEVLWVDNDFRSIPEPKARALGFFDAFFSSEASERWKKATDIPRWVRSVAGSPKKAANVNLLDEVPDSSWYTNRHALRHMTIEQLVRGPNRGGEPDLTHATITRAKVEGVTPGLQVTDNKGENYLIKFDNKNYPELQSGAEVISTKILYAAGYNVPENYIGYLDPDILKIKDGVEITSGKKKRPFTRDDLDTMLQKAARRPDGTYRVLASKLLKGTSKGPFAYVGLRTDDPNDLIPHEHRRELRGLRVIASWINHWDLKEMNTLDMYVDEGGRKFLRHYLIDFGSTLGGGKSPMEYFHGREYEIDGANMLKELATLGFYVTPDEKDAPLVFPSVGIFSADDFKPKDWKPSFHVMPFDNMTDEDAFWATRVILSFTNDELLNIVNTAEYARPEATDYVLRTLLERRRLIAAHWLEDVNPISNFALDVGQEGIALKFNDLMAEHDLAGPAEYKYQVTSFSQGRKDGHRSQETRTSMRRIPLGPAIAGETRVKIWTTREEFSSRPVMVYVRNKPGGGYGISRIERL
jgi:hypothetical protein